MDDLGARNGEIASRVIVNHAGNNKSKPVVSEPLKKTCTMPFREISITWNGNINLCCQDWKSQFIIENVNEKTIEEIWYSKRFESGRAMLQNKDRNMSPCNKCDIGSGSRSGLLPKYGPVTEEDRKVVNMDIDKYREYANK
jgi:radical SAM protein with 4Fe4S-binding SPASM domain